MPYHITCQCGHAVQIEIWQCGTSVNCPTCSAEIHVPDSITLQEQSGEKYPLLSPREKFIKSARNGESPFDGRCHGCTAVTAEISVPIWLAVMDERAVHREGRIRPSLGGGLLKMSPSKATETWNTITFPLLLCRNCYAAFERDALRSRQRKNAHNLLCFIVFLCFLWFAYEHLQLIAALAGIISLIGAIAWIALQRQKSKVDPDLMTWLGRVRWFPETIAGEEEFLISIGKRKPYVRNGPGGVAANQGN